MMDGVVRAKRAEMARGIAVDRLDLDHACALVGQQHRAIGTGQHLGEVDHLQAGEGAGDVGHVKAPFRVPAGCEEIAHETVIRDLEDRRLLVLVDGDDDFESFMPARCWMAPEMPTAM